MLLGDLLDRVGGEMVYARPHAEGIEVVSCFAADLMSDVLAFARPGAILVTGLASVQAAHAADVADLAAVLFVAGKRPGEPVIELAAKKGIPLAVTRRSMYEVCGALHAAGVAPGHRVILPPETPADPAAAGPAGPEALAGDRP